MGDLQTKPIQNQDLKHLQQQYEPFSKGKRIPGEPIYLKLNSIFQKSQYCDRITNRFKKLERYTVFLRTTERGLQSNINIYDYRRTNLSCIVQVVYYCVDKDECQCSNNTYKIIVYTEHVETRLAHFKTTNKAKSNSFQNLQYYEYFTLDQAIYVLISCLHAYELLFQQFVVNYPTPLTIGINYKAQVKVWINQNWAINQQNHRKLNENLVIEQIINLIQERMESNFNAILNVTTTYMNFTFTSIQEMLAKYTIHYQRGKKSLQDRLNNRSFKDKDKSTIFSQKIPLNRNRTNSNHNSNIPLNHQNITTFTTQIEKIAQKRHSSHQQIKKQQANPVTSIVRKYSITPRTTTYQSPKKTIKFVYHPSLTERPSPKTNQHKQQISPFQQNHKSNQFKGHPMALYGSKQGNGQFSIKPVPCYNQPMTPLPVSSEYFDRTAMNSIIDKKLKSQSKESSINNKISQVSNTTAYRRQTPHLIKNMGYNFEKINQLQSDQTNIIQGNSKEQRKIQFNLSDQYLKKSSYQLNKTSQNASLSEITQQFKHLLKSDHKIQQRQQLFYNYQDLSLNDKDQQRQRQGLDNSDHHPYITSFQEIKEEDQDINYSIDQPL